jgi:hypothetical protein
MLRLAQRLHINNTRTETKKEKIMKIKSGVKSGGFLDGMPKPKFGSGN